MRDLLALPKCDLHVHLEGSVRPSTLVELAAKNGCPLPPGLRDGRYVFTDFHDFISQYILATRCLVEADDFRRIAREFCEDEASQGAVYAEVTFTLAGHAYTMGGDWSAPIEAVLAGFAEGEAATGVRCQLVVDHPRGFPPELADQTLDAVLPYAGRGVVAFGLGGNEDFPPEPYASVFQRAKREGLGSVPHAGEAAGASSVWGALRDLQADRIGHGVRCLEDPALVEYLGEREVPLEVCPTSNVVLGIVPSLAEHPLPRLIDAGLTVTLNSDDPAMFSSPLLGEYEAARSLGLDDASLAKLARNGARAAFVDTASRSRIEAAIDGWFA